MKKKHWLLSLENPEKYIECPQIKSKDKGCLMEFSRCTERFKAAEIIDNGCKDCKVYLQECVDRLSKNIFI